MGRGLPQAVLEVGWASLTPLTSGDPDGHPVIPHGDEILGDHRAMAGTYVDSGEA